MPEAGPLASMQATPSHASRSGLDQAITSMDRVLTVHMKTLESDLHRTMYQTFVRICAAYARWKIVFTPERQAAVAAANKEKATSGRRSSTASAGERQQRKSKI